MRNNSLHMATQVEDRSISPLHNDSLMRLVPIVYSYEDVSVQTMISSDDQ